MSQFVIHKLNEEIEATNSKILGGSAKNFEQYKAWVAVAKEYTRMRDDLIEHLKKQERDD